MPIATSDKEQLDLDAKSAAAHVLNSSTLSEIWKNHRVTQQENSPFDQSADALSQMSKRLRYDKNLLNFVTAIVEVECESLGNRNTQDENEETRALYNLLAYLKDEGGNTSDYALEMLPEDQQDAITALKRAAGQNEIQVVRGTWRTIKKTSKHIWEDIKEHPKSFTALLAASLGTLAFMNMRMGSMATIYIDPEMTAITNMDADSFLSLGDEASTYTPQIDPSFLDFNGPAACDNHIRYLIGGDDIFGIDAATISDTISNFGLTAQHCGRVKSLAENAQANLQGGYDWINTRLDFIIRDPATDIANTVLPESAFRAAFNNAAHQTAEFIYAANAVENVALHSIIFGSAMAATVKLGTMESDERREIVNGAKDFVYRTFTQTPLSPIFATAAAGYAYMANNGLSPDMIWMGAAGAVTGCIVHRAAKKRKARELAEDILKEASDDIQKFDFYNPIVSDLRAGEDLSAPRKWYSWQNLFGKKSAAAITATTILTTVDVIATGGQVTGSVLGGLGVTIPFLAYNVPEDAALHVIFGVAGSAAGAGVLATRKGYQGVKKGCKAVIDYFKKPPEP